MVHYCYEIHKCIVCQRNLSFKVTTSVADPGGGGESAAAPLFCANFIIYLLFTLEVGLAGLPHNVNDGKKKKKSEKKMCRNPPPPPPHRWVTFFRPVAAFPALPFHKSWIRHCNIVLFKTNIFCKSVMLPFSGLNYRKPVVFVIPWTYNEWTFNASPPLK